MTTATDQATLPAQGTETESNAAAQAAALTEAADEAAAEPTDSGDEGNTDSKEHAETEVEKLRRKTQRRIDRLTAEKGAAQERIRALEAAAEANANTGETDKPKTEDPREIAKQMLAARETEAATSRVMKEAKAKFPEFEKNVAELVEEVGPLIDKRTGVASPLLAAVFDSDRAAELLNHLGENVELAAELVGLSEAKIGRRIHQLETELAAEAKPKTSAAARPLTPVKPSAVTVTDEAKLTDAQVYALRRKQRLAA